MPVVTWAVCGGKVVDSASVSPRMSRGGAPVVLSVPPWQKVQSVRQSEG